MNKRPLLAAAMSALLLVGCSSGDATPPVATAPAKELAKPAADDLIEIGAVTGLGYSADGKSLYAATRGALLQHQQEGWSKPINEFDLTAMTVTEKSLYVSGHPSSGTPFKDPLGLLKSTNGGKKFEWVSLHGEAELTMLASSYHKGTIYTYSPNQQGDFGAGLASTDDEGAHWIPAQLKTQRLNIRAMAVHPDLGNVLALATKDAVEFSENHGDQLTARSTFFTNATALAFDLANPDTLYVATADGDGSKLYAFDDYRQLKTTAKTEYEPLITLPTGNTITAIASNRKSDELAFATESHNIYQISKTKPSLQNAALTQNGAVKIEKK